MPDALITTKVRVLGTRTELVPRPRLRETLVRNEGRRLTLVSAPAGFGKTTLLGEWLEDRSGDGRSVAWLSLEEADNDPARFLAYLVSALRFDLGDGIGEGVLASLRLPEFPPVEAVVGILINELADVQREEITIVLDDYHVIHSRPVHEATSFLLKHLPENVRLVISGRADPPLPLSRLRARDQVTEIRAAELRFTTEEATAFLTGVMGLTLSAADVATLEAITEGWIAALQLAALSMRDREDISGFVETFSGSNRHVLDFLAEEVLERQSEGVREFLVKTCVLERMHAPLCDTLTGRNDGQQMLERLEHDNLFVIALDDERRWYRYHHLFADVLRQRLSQRQVNWVPELHKRASGWFEEEGLVAEAIHHALAAQDWERAVRLIESSGIAVLLGKQVQTMLGWIDGLPEEVVRERPVLCTIHALALVFLNRPDAAESRLQQAEWRLGANPTTDEARAILGQVAQLRAIIARVSGDLVRCVELARRALELLPETEMLFRSGARANVALAYQVSGDVAPANELPLEEAIVSFRASGALIPLLNVINFLARLRTLQGRLRAAAATYEEAAEVVLGRERVRDLVNSAAYYVGLGDIQREWNDLDSAESHLRRGTDLVSGAFMVDADVVTHGYLSIARLQQARGRHDDAYATLDEFANLARQRDFFSLLIARGEAAQARLALMQDDLPSAVSWSEACGLVAGDEPSYPREEEYLTLVRILIAQGRLDSMGSYLDDALGLLGRLFKTAEDGGRMGSVIEILALRALALQARQSSSEALAALESSLVLAEAEGYVRVFVDEGAPMKALLLALLKARRKGGRGAKQLTSLTYVRRLLAAFESPHRGTEPLAGAASDTIRPLPDPLTARERDVLELVADGLSNQEIAARLFIATSTVKGYIHSLLRKLEVDSRTKAISRAHEMDLLSE